MARTKTIKKEKQREEISRNQLYASAKERPEDPGLSTLEGEDREQESMNVWDTDSKKRPKRIKLEKPQEGQLKETFSNNLDSGDKKMPQRIKLICKPKQEGRDQMELENPDAGIESTRRAPNTPERRKRGCKHRNLDQLRRCYSKQCECLRPSPNDERRSRTKEQKDQDEKRMRPLEVTTRFSEIDYHKGFTGRGIKPWMMDRHDETGPFGETKIEGGTSMDVMEFEG